MNYVTINGFGVSLDIDDADFKDEKLNKHWREVVTNQNGYDIYDYKDVSIYYANNTNDFDMLLVIEPVEVVMANPKPIKIYTPEEAKSLLKEAIYEILNNSSLDKDEILKFYALACKKIDIEAHLSEDNWTDAY